MKKNVGNSRLEYMLHKLIKSDPECGSYLVSCYMPKKIYKDVYPTITTRIDGANNHFIIEVTDE